MERAERRHDPEQGLDRSTTAELARWAGAEVVIGGSACPEAMMKAFEDKYDTRVIHAWGMTEMSPIGTTGKMKHATSGWDQEARLKLKEKQGDTDGSDGEDADSYSIALNLTALIFMLALAGIPPTAGFMGKLYLWAATVEAGYIVLAVISVLMSAVSLYYYFRIVVQMYLKDSGEDIESAAEVLRDRWTAVVISVCAVATLAIGVWPAPIPADAFARPDQRRPGRLFGDDDRVEQLAAGRDVVPARGLMGWLFGSRLVVALAQSLRRQIGRVLRVEDARRPGQPALLADHCPHLARGNRHFRHQ